MKATDFNLPKDLEYYYDEGLNLFQATRMVFFDANALGLLREEVTAELGWEKARRLFLRFGFQHGLTDFMQMKLSYRFDTEMDLLASGPVIHTWQGLVHAAPGEIRFDRDSGDFFFTGTWTNSYEAQQYLAYHRPGHEPVCWSLMGYASGWCTGFFGKPVIAIEPVCMGMGHDHCEWLIRPPREHGDAAAYIVEALQGLI